MENLKKDLVKLLTENAKYSYSDLAAMLGVEESAVKNAVKEMENDGVIVKYSAIIDTEALEDKLVQALIEVKVAPQKLKGFDSTAEEIYHFKEVTSLYLMSGGFDLAVFVEGKDLGDIAAFVSEKLSVIDGIIGVQTHFILKKYKIEGQIVKKGDLFERELVQA
ncbi:MAG: Lrp/AsnC family transcriptional regulator [Clostridia bacterium]|nr:Lrp/AsnC family transcriptional regulator [Clostridia bacterium]